MINLSFDEMVEIFNACDSSYDGFFYTAVKTTGIYCRPSCTARKPKKENVTFFPTAKDAQNAGFRPCKRCQPNVINFDPKMELVKHAKAYINQHYKDKLTLEKIARHVGASPYHLDRLFKEKTSQTPRAYLEKVRVEMAVHLLQTTDLSNLKICFEVGFQNASSFYNAFRRLKHCSPKQYRKDVSHDL
jgi:AraC family transcriptional regulator of adaptative response / methylphosphotriester-DNA alkyltransferase methyltransferase